ncbi:MAG: NnrU family protein, partial [Gammaproteobacteria bacterium]|nr:NnrU family protein [Gammaproteobacteria bacterium]
MLQLLSGIVLFFGMHSVSILALPLRDRIAAKSDLVWKAAYGLVSLIGIVLMVRGYAELRQTPTVLYVPPAGLRHVAALLMLPVFAFFIAPYFPGRIKRALKHPQLVAVKAW